MRGGDSGRRVRVAGAVGVWDHRANGCGVIPVGCQSFAIEIQE
jgi:hypothetical protein